MDLDYLVSAFVTLLVVVEPLGLAPVFVAATSGLEARTKRIIAFRASVYALAILVGSALIGQRLLGAMGISIPAFRIAGGFLLFSIASEMVFGVRIQRDSKAAEKALAEHVHNIAAYPLAIPLMAGPGAITATVLLASDAHGSVTLIATLIAVIAAIMTICLVFCLIAGEVAQFFGTAANVVLTRLLGVLLAALAVQFVADGVRAFLQG
ncbi:MarC family protein [Methylosinus sp. H3A]|uniref:MarC family protein n=1 Tax=Methylosinus sp. H3A TaxID=2785786 RepID=UPI0018C2B18D|nr:MarC family protein [Methylosinus sp. H3A]MBG0812213.1 MarC family protein [Methylosinus sp. H3A]